jgi:MtN3 and saliva related transmembrane protein
MITILGLVAAALTSAAGLPQVIKSIKEKSTKGLSLFMILQLLAGISLWTVYGFIKGDAAILFAQGIAYIFYTILLVLKIKYK